MLVWAKMDRLTHMTGQSGMLLQRGRRPEPPVVLETHGGDLRRGRDTAGGIE